MVYQLFKTKEEQSVFTLSLGSSLAVINLLFLSAQEPYPIECQTLGKSENWAINILNKSEKATHLLLVKMAEKRFLFQFHFCKMKCLTCAVHVF